MVYDPPTANKFMMR